MQVGRRLTEITILSRSVVRIWGTLERVLGRHEHTLSRSDRTMRVVHVSLDGGASNIIGACPSPCRVVARVGQRHLQLKHELAAVG